MRIISDGPNAGLPEQPTDGKTASFYEFWPTWVMYLPVVFAWLIWSVKYRSASLPLLANPNVFLAGMIGESKADLLYQAGERASAFILPFVLFEYRYNASSFDIFIEGLVAEMSAKNIHFPCVIKPDQGCRGAGVQLLYTIDQLKNYVIDFPEGEKCMVQRLSQYSAEAGVFYVREPQSPTGHVVSITLKYRAYVVGDGVKTVEQLVRDDSRATKLKDLYRQRLSERWVSVPQKGEYVPLVFAGSHCRGSVFKDGCQYISEGLSTKIDSILSSFPQFHYGRLDIKFKAIDRFVAGEAFEIIEVNGASSEQTHIWDAQSSFFDAIKALLWQYHTLFKIGDQLREQGLQPPPLSLLIKTWWAYLKAGKKYPETH